MPKEELLTQVRQAIHNGDTDAATTLANQVLSSNMDPLDAITQCTEEMRKVGKEFEDGNIFLPEVMMAAEALKALLAVLSPKLQEGKERKYLGKVVIATVLGDVHDLGKNIVATLLEAQGFQVFNLGRDIPADAIINKAKEVDADIIGASALMTSTVLEQRRIKDAIHRAGLQNRVKYFVGGAAVSNEWATELGAIRGEDAIDTVAKAKEAMMK
jgi:trimethylamine corrinoid protein